MRSCKFDFGNVNESQRKAIINTEGPVLMIAGPGTGKTFTLVKRIAYLVVEKNVAPSEIMVVTFTEKAAKELLTRISNEFSKYELQMNLNEMYIGTFHSVCLRILKENMESTDEYSECRVLDAFEQTYLICRNIDRFRLLREFHQHISAKDEWKQAMEVCRYVGQMMEELVNAKKYENDKDLDIRLLSRMVLRYLELLRENNCMDFSMIQTNTYEMLQKYPEVLEKLQKNIRYFMVDEYQDTNYIQEQLLFMLAKKSGNICVVGDDDQGMYRFRGATIRNILEFPSKFAEGECKIIHLNQNYRSEPEIIDFYNRWMENSDGVNLFNWDKYRYAKTIVSGRTDTESGHSVFSCVNDNMEDEKENLYLMLQNLMSNGNIDNYNQVAFLFRSVKSEEAIAIGNYFESKGIAVYSPRSDLFFERNEVKQMLGCLIACFKSYMTDLKANQFLHKISGKLRQYYIECLKSAMALFRSNPALYQYVNMVSHEIESLKEQIEGGCLNLFYHILAFSPFSDYLQTDLRENITKTRATRNLSEISRMLSKYAFLHDMHSITKINQIAMPEELFNIYLRYMIEDGIGEYEDESEYAPDGCVSFMTIHQSKGLEFPVVVVGSLGNTPRRNSDPLLYTAETKLFCRAPFEPLADIKYFDFWRLYYTAFSRAQNMLVLTTKKQDAKYFKDFIEVTQRIETFASKHKFESVKEVNYKHMYSFTSHISVYDGCPKQYKFYKEYAFAQNQMFQTSVGSLVHATLEDLNKCVMSGRQSEITKERIKQWFELNYQSMQKQTGYFLDEQQYVGAFEQILHYYDYRKEELCRVWKAEEEINLVLPHYILQGIIDLMDGVGDTIEIVDYKTGPMPDIEGHPERVEHYRKQLEVYAYLVEKQYHKKVTRMHLFYTSKLEENPMITFEYEKKNIEATVAEIDATIQKIENKDFCGDVTNNYACKFCDMKYVCGMS